MRDYLKKKLEAYENGELSPEQAKEVEKELEMIEKSLGTTDEKAKGITPYPGISINKQQKIMRRAKWKARLQTAFTVIGIFLLFSFVSAVLTGFYYSVGEPDQSGKWRSVIDYSMTVTDPYGQMGSTTTNTTAYFGLEATTDMNKMVGDEIIKVGEIETDFLFSFMFVPQVTYLGATSIDKPGFTYPGIGSRGYSGWEQLEKIHEGTVASAYVSFTDLLETEQVFSLFSYKDMRLLWLAVDTGFEQDQEVITEPIGFPRDPIWHENDMILESRKEEKGLFGSHIVSESHSSPDYEVGEEKPLHTQFLKTLRFLQEHERKASNFYMGDLNLSERIEYLEENGYKHYGAVITGPSKEILKLKDEAAVSDLEIDEVGFWNWDSTE